jgi:hypothetical protein
MQFRGGKWSIFIELFMHACGSIVLTFTTLISGKRTIRSWTRAGGHGGLCCIVIRMLINLRTDLDVLV